MVACNLALWDTELMSKKPTGKSMKRPKTLLRDIFGFSEFRPGQSEIIDAVVDKKNVLAIMPTGGGKSLCFQIPALMGEGLTVVISPLIALMRDQVRGLQAAGVAAEAITSANTEEETDKIFSALNSSKLRILYLAPERLASTAMQSALHRYNVVSLVVDEAHCVSQWGHDFRPDYLRIGELRRSLGVPLAAFTATADEETRQEIIERLFDGIAPSSFLHGFDRPNIHFTFVVKNNPRRQIIEFVNQRKGQPGIIYCGTRAKTETLAKALEEVGHSTCHYHGGMSSADRRVVESRFSGEDGLIVVATVAFGMGIDKPDIRWVAHADLPKSIESFYQEIGRAGRDGGPAAAYTLYGADDIRLRRSQIDEGLASVARKSADHGRLNALLGLAEALTCRRRTLLQYFGESNVECKNCDLCERPPETFDATQPVRKALSAILRTGEYFGAGYLIDILLGIETDKVRSHGHQSLPTFGVGKELSRLKWQAIFRQMMGHDLVRPDPNRHGALKIMESALAILGDKKSITLRMDTIESTKSSPKIKMLVSEEDAPLLSGLKAKRRELAETAGVPAYIIFNDKTLVEMAQKRPINLDAMAQINGVGAKKLENFGNTFLEVINGEAERLHPSRRKLAGNKEGVLFDLLLEAQNKLTRGEKGLDKPLSCSTSLLVKVAQRRPSSIKEISHILGERRAERFGAAFLEIFIHAD